MHKSLTSSSRHWASGCQDGGRPRVMCASSGSDCGPSCGCAARVTGTGQHVVQRRAEVGGANGKTGTSPFSSCSWQPSLRAPVSVSRAREGACGKLVSARHYEGRTTSVMTTMTASDGNRDGRQPRRSAFPPRPQTYTRPTSQAISWSNRRSAARRPGAAGGGAEC